MRGCGLPAGRGGELPHGRLEVTAGVALCTQWTDLAHLSLHRSVGLQRVEAAEGYQGPRGKKIK